MLYYSLRRFSWAVQLLLLSVLSFLFSSQAAAELEADVDYRLGASDVVLFTVFGEEDLSVERTVDSRGNISFPLLGSINVQGLTLTELEAEVTALLKGDYLINPRVNAVIDQYRPFYVRGEVKDPGGFPFQPGLTLDKAVAVAGGFTERASRKKVEVSREKADGSREELVMPLEKQVRPGDIIIVKESFF